MIATPALPELRQIAKNGRGYVIEMRDFSICWPHRSTDIGACRDGEVLAAEGWDGDHLYGAVLPADSIRSA